MIDLELDQFTVHLNELVIMVYCSGEVNNFEILFIFYKFFKLGPFIKKKRNFLN